MNAAQFKAWIGTAAEMARDFDVDQISGDKNAAEKERYRLRAFVAFLVYEIKYDHPALAATIQSVIDGPHPPAKES